ncbi:MAG: CPXCG motif-containing cysteine-rich protein [Bacteroidota bacterium]
MQQIEHFFDCPYCGAPISMLLEPLYQRQQYIEDCEVCCNPIQIQFAGDPEGLTEFDAISIEQ